MLLDRVTITGADDSVHPNDLIALTREFPFVEWGILFSRRHAGAPRFPTKAWAENFAALRLNGMRVAAHLCGAYVRELVTDGLLGWHAEYRQLGWHGPFVRVQLNCHGVSNLDGLRRIVKTTNLRFIAQCDGVHDDEIGNLELSTAGQVVPLFDTSGGAGLSPTVWPLPWTDTYCGYAGGLGPDNLAAELVRIGAAAGNARVWIDMERNVRTADDKALDLDKVRRVLELAAPHVPVEIA